MEESSGGARAPKGCLAGRCRGATRPKKKQEQTAESTKNAKKKSKAKELARAVGQQAPQSQPPQAEQKKSTDGGSSALLTASASAGPVKRPMPSRIHPMLAESIDEPFDGQGWLFEIKWDGYRAIAFIEQGKTRLVSRNQNDLTPRYP